MAWTDTEGDSINHSQFTLTDASGQLNAVKSGDNYLIQPKNNLSGSTVYHITGSIKDEHGFGTGTAEQKFTIAQSGNGSLGGDTTSYIIESGQNGNPIRDIDVCAVYQGIIIILKRFHRLVHHIQRYPLMVVDNYH